MSSDKNIQIKQYNGTDWDNLYPKTLGQNVKLSDGSALGYVPINKAGDAMTGSLILNADPTQPLHAATKQYVDAVKQGLDIKESVKVATVSNITLSGTQTIDGVSVAANDRVLVMNQTAASQNGIYTAQTGSWARASDFDGIGGDVTSGSFTFVEQGTTNAGNGFVLTAPNPITIGTTSLTFTQFSGAGQISPGAGLNKVGNTLLLSNVGTPGTYKSVTTDAQGRVTAGANPSTLLGYGITDATPSSHVGATGSAHGAVTASANGFMLSADKSKLDGVAYGATATADSSTNGNIKINGAETNVYTHPNDSNTRHVSDAEITAWNGKQNNITISATAPTSPTTGDLYYAIV